MTFAEDFAQCFAQYGVTVTPETLPEQSLLKEALTYQPGRFGRISRHDHDLILSVGI